MKKSSRQTRIGEAGVALIASRVSAMGHHWHKTSGPDSGIDGEIELVDPGTGRVRNFRIGVQSKATEGIWRRETDEGFLYKVDPDDLDYWLSSNQPVLLVCCRPRTDEAYFRNVQDWAKEPRRRASLLVDLDKQRDRFDETATARFFSTEPRSPGTVEPPGPLPRPERLTSNLLPVYFDAEVIWSAPAPTHEWGEVFDRARSAGVARSDVALREGRLWSLQRFSEAYLKATGVKDAPDSVPLEEYADADEGDRRHLLGELLRRSLMNHFHHQLRWSGPARVAYFRLYQDRPERKFKWGRGGGRTVVRARQSLRHEGLSGYRHDAAELRFRRLAGRWVMSITPTYLFTFDGTQLSSFHAEALKRMKEQDGPAAVSQQLRMWIHLFTRQRDLIGQTEPPMHFGQPIDVKMPVTPPTEAWTRPPENAAGEADDEEASLSLFEGTDVVA